MTPPLASPEGVTVVLATGGTIAGRAASPEETLRYASAQIGVAELVGALPTLGELPLELEQVAQVDSKDMGPAVWARLAARVAHHLARPQVGGIVVTHGTDTLEETAYFLHRLLAPARPVVLTAAMRPATALQADGPQNLLDAVTVARTPGACGVVAVMAGQVFHPVGLRKAHTTRLDAFSGGDAGPIGRLEDGALRRWREWPRGEPLGLGAREALEALQAAPEAWPRVEVVMNHAGADGRLVRALCAQGLDGLVLAGTGHGTLAADLEEAARQARAQGVRVLRASRCAAGPVLPGDADALAAAGELGPAQARVELLLQLLGQRGGLPSGSAD